MKKIFCLLLVLPLILCGCQGNFGKVDLQDAIPLGEDGMVSQKTIEQIRNDNAIGIFTGIAPNLYIALESMDILILLIFLIHKHKYLPIYFSSIPFINVL